MRISDWSSDVCSSDLVEHRVVGRRGAAMQGEAGITTRKLGVGAPAGQRHRKPERLAAGRMQFAVASPAALPVARERAAPFEGAEAVAQVRSEAHTSELQSLMRISSAVFCLKQKNQS